MMQIALANSSDYPETLLLLVYLLALGRAYIFRVFLRDDIKHFYTFLHYNIKIGDIGHYYEGIGTEKIKVPSLTHSEWLPCGAAWLPAAPGPTPAVARLPTSVVSTTTFGREATASGFSSPLMLTAASWRVPRLV
jgi:hypothetical protein